MAHYTNPAFCQKSELYPNSPVKSSKCDYAIGTTRTRWTTQIVPKTIYQSEQQQKIQQRELPPKPGPKPNNFQISIDSIPNEYAKHTAQSNKTQYSTNGYALVPLDELPSLNKERYAILPSKEAYMMCNSSLRLARSQDDLDFISPGSVYEEEDSFTSLPAFMPKEGPHTLTSAFSTDFVNKSMILFDQNSKQKYTIIPTDADEEVVDTNHEILEMHNGRVHRYAVIPTDDDDAGVNSANTDQTTIVSNKNSVFKANAIQRTPTKIEPITKKHILSSTGQDVAMDLSFNGAIRTKPNFSLNMKSQSTLQIDQNWAGMPGTPTKNPIATQKLHELLSTPRKSKQETLQRHGSYQTIIQRSPNNQFQLKTFHSPPKHAEFTPQKLQYEIRNVQTRNIEQRTTAVISPRLHQQSIYNDTTLCDDDKPWPQENFQKVENATATIGIISLMLILTGVINSGLCLYMVSDVSNYYQQDAIILNFVVFIFFLS